LIFLLLVGARNQKSDPGHSAQGKRLGGRFDYFQNFQIKIEISIAILNSCRIVLTALPPLPTHRVGRGGSAMALIRISCLSKGCRLWKGSYGLRPICWHRPSSPENVRKLKIKIP